jgi:hypothetical protein
MAFIGTRSGQSQSMGFSSISAAVREIGPFVGPETL